MTAARYRAGKRLWEPEDDAALRAAFPHMRTATLAEQLRRSAIADVARVVVESAKVEVAFLDVTGAVKSTGFLPDADAAKVPAARRIA